MSPDSPKLFSFICLIGTNALYYVEVLWQISYVLPSNSSSSLKSPVLCNWKPFFFFIPLKVMLENLKAIVIVMTVLSAILVPLSTVGALLHHNLQLFKLSSECLN